MALSEIKSYVEVLSFEIKMMKRKNLHVCSLKHSIKKGMLYVQGNQDVFKSGKEKEGGGSPPSSLASGLVCFVLYHCFIIIITIIIELTHSKTILEITVESSHNQ